MMTKKCLNNCLPQSSLLGANVNMKTNNQDEETPLHTAAHFGLAELVAFYVEHGAIVDSVNAHMETPLAIATYWALRFKEQEYSREHHLICRMLLDYKAEVNARDDDFKSPLHKAAWNCDHVLMHMMLEAGAEANLVDINGCAAIQYVLKVTSVRPAAQPEICYQLLLNHGAARIYPPQFHKVRQACHLLRRMSALKMIEPALELVCRYERATQFSSVMSTIID
uniref:Uncharacterized protein n=1 Tax=Sus scrofa TaxID=9823 RepID=A0A4X1SYI5_PIG